MKTFKIILMEIKEIVKNCNSLNEIFREIDRHYDLDKKLGVVSGSVVKSYIQKVIEICKIEPR